MLNPCSARPQLMWTKTRKCTEPPAACLKKKLKFWQRKRFHILPQAIIDPNFIELGKSKSRFHLISYVLSDSKYPIKHPTQNLRKNFRNKKMGSIFIQNLPPTTAYLRWTKTEICSEANIVWNFAQRSWPPNLLHLLNMISGVKMGYARSEVNIVWNSAQGSSWILMYSFLRVPF